MEGKYLFILLIVILSVVVYRYKVEGFKNPLLETETEKKPIIPVVKTVNVSSPDAYAVPAEQEYGPAFGEIARTNSLPYRDPAQETATYKALNSVKQALSGFLGFEAKGLQEQSDPSVQLPLTTLRSDYQRVSEEADVLKRNPGINSQLTVNSLNEIQSNLQYLQRKFRLSVNNDVGVEGFEDASLTNSKATLQDVKDALSKVKIEIIRMSASGTTDPVLVARVNVLTKISQKLQSIIDEVNSGIRTVEQIPILKRDLQDFLHKSSDVSAPIPDFLSKNNLPLTLANLFPAYQAGDISGAAMTQYLFNKYGDTLMNGLSWNVGIKYTSPNEVQSSGKKNRNANGAQLLSPFTLDSITNQLSTRGEFQSATESEAGFESTSASLIPDMKKENEKKKLRDPAHYDWKEKSSKICEAIRARGLNPGNFGCIGSSSSVGNDYSWRGNARMVCTRLQASYDPGLPEYCGCPPVDWPGWRA